jgi:cytidine deaminase
MLLHLLDAHGHDNQMFKAFDIRSSCMQPCDHAEHSAITSTTSPYPLRFQPTMVERLNAMITPVKVSNH